MSTSTSTANTAIDKQVSIDQNEALDTRHINAKLANPLSGFTHDQLMEQGEAYARAHGMEHLVDEFRKGAVLAQDHKAYDRLPFLSGQEKAALHREQTKKWQHPRQLYYMVVMCSVAAAVQGMGTPSSPCWRCRDVLIFEDQTVINGANLFFVKDFGIDAPTRRNEWLLGIVNSAPYFSCALVACWFTDPLNRHFGRRGAIFITCAIACLTCLWQAFTNSWWHLFIARFVGLPLVSLGLI